MNTPANPALLLRRLEQQGISVSAVATRLRMDPAHLRRVLRGERPARAALLQSVAELAETMEEPRPPRDPEDIERLIEAAAHMFFLRRGRFESAICARLQRETAREDDLSNQ